MKDAAWIVASWRMRESAQGPQMAVRRKIRDHYDGDTIIALPEMERSERPAIANLQKTGIDQTARLIASTLPTVYFPPVRPSVQASLDKSNVRRKATLGWWDRNRLDKKMYRRARQLVAYGCAPVMLRPNYEWEIAQWEIRDPLTCFPSLSGDPDDLRPSDCIFAYERSAGFVRATWPTAFESLRRKSSQQDTDMLTVVEYADDSEWVLVVVGDSSTGDRSLPYGTMYSADGYLGSQHEVVLERVENRIGVCPVIIPGGMTLGRPQGQFDQTLPMYTVQARMQSLLNIAVEKSIYPDAYLVGNPGETPVFLSGPFDGRTGQVNVVKGGKVEYINNPPSPLTQNVINELERNQRVMSGVSPDMGGECVDVDTEILTASGWRRYDEVSVGDEVLTLNHDTGMSEWLPVQRMNVFPAESRQLVEMQGTRFSALTTQNHAWPVVTASGKRLWKNSTEIGYEDRIQQAAVCADLPVEAKWSDALVELVAWMYTEGSLRPSGGQVSQSVRVNPENVDRIRACLTATFGPPVARWRDVSGAGQGGAGHDGVPRWNESPPAANDVIKFNLSVHATRMVEQHAPGKVPTYDFLRSLTAAQLELFIRVSMLADNCGPERFGQKDVARSEAFAFALILAGRPLSYRHRVKQESRDGWRGGEYEANIVQMRRRGWAVPVAAAARRDSARFGLVEHDGAVWCPTTANHSWMARREGSVYFTGNSGSNIRTGRRGESILSTQVDPGVQEAQLTFQASLEEENKVAIAITKTYFGNKRKSFYVKWRNAGAGGTGQVDYTANDAFENDNNVVVYPHAGSDQASLTIGLGQRLGEGLISKHTAQDLDPMIADGERERDLIVKEQIEAGLLQMFLAQAQQGAITPADAAKIAQLVWSNKMDLAAAMTKVHEEAQVRQAANPAAAPGDPSAPVDPNSPDAQPGLGAPGMGAEAGSQPVIPPPGQSGTNLADLLNTLRRPNRLSADEKGAAA